MAQNATTQWEVRDGGSDSNGGGFDSAAAGVDRTLQDAAHVVIDGVTITAIVHTTTTQLNITGHTVHANDVGNHVQNVSGTGTVGYFRITAVNTVNNRWTIDRSGGTAAQTFIGNMGGALKTPGAAAAAVGVSGQKIWWKGNVTSTITTATPGKGGPVMLPNVNILSIEGYLTSRGDRAARPTLDAGAITSVNLFHHGTISVQQGHTFISLAADGQGNASVNGFAPGNTGSGIYQQHSCIDCLAIDCVNGFFDASATRCKAEGCTTGFTLCFPQFCWASGCTTGFNASSMINGPKGCIATGCTTGFTHGLPSGQATTCVNCIADSCTTVGFSSTAANNCDYVNCLASNMSGVGDVGFVSTGGIRLFNCAGYNNTVNVSGTPSCNQGFVTLTADPYVNRAGGDFRPNTTAGGGAALRAAGIGVYGQTNNTDIGAVQHTDAGGGDPFPSQGLQAIESGVAA